MSISFPIGRDFVLFEYGRMEDLLFNTVGFFLIVLEFWKE